VCDLRSEMAELKHLGFVRVAALNAAACISSLYDYAKQNSGSLKSAFGRVEDAVTAVVRPVYDRINGVPDDVLVFLDKKVDDLSNQFDERAPPMAKTVVGKVQQVVKTTSSTVMTLGREAVNDGPRAALSHALTLYKAFAVYNLALLWYVANRYHQLHLLGVKVIPTVGHWSEEYNQFMAKMDARGYHIFGY